MIPEARLQEIEQWFGDWRNDLQGRARSHAAELLKEVRRLAEVERVARKIAGERDKTAWLPALRAALTEESDQKEER